MESFVCTAVLYFLSCVGYILVCLSYFSLNILFSEVCHNTIKNVLK